MLKLTDIYKYYKLGEEKVAALNNVNISFGKSEFVSILGSSGSGKTTLLNLIGGLDRYSTGDLIIDGKSTKEFKDKDWDSYRNNTIGFVFQSYNLIPHLSVLDNVSIALSLSGVSSKERIRIAKQSLTDVGLEKHMYKKPNQLSGGQMQRVAIARALVNNPKILLADEPTGALDSTTSIQIMELIKKISKDRLVIMVTHNPELAKKYSDRIVKLSDGLVVEDTLPYIEELKDKNEKFKTKKTSMSFFTALKSSFKNLITKKTRTSITAFAGSIGIISIALVLAISSGMGSYVDTLQIDTLSGFPITISQTSSTSFDRLRRFTSPTSDENMTKTDGKTVSAQNEAEIHNNLYSEDVLGKGYTFSDYIVEKADKYSSSISFTSGYKMKALTNNYNGELMEVKAKSTYNRNVAIMNEIPTNSDYVLDQYEVIASVDDEFTYPTKADEAVLVVDSNAQLSKVQLEALGFKSDENISYTDIIGKTYSIIQNDNYYELNENSNIFNQRAINEDMYNNGFKIKITGVLMADEDSMTSALSSGIGYTKALTDYMMGIEKDSKIVSAQKANTKESVIATNQSLLDETTYKLLMQQLGGDNTPTQISIYPKSFDEKEKIIELIDKYNKMVIDKYGSNEKDYKKYSIDYTDLAKTIASTMTSMIDTITIILTAFAAISLVVSSIMIGIITYVSVVERTKEIGIMRAIGARKKDISRIFNAEAVIIGLFSGLLGVLIASLITIPINSIISNSLGIEGFSAALPYVSGVLLVFLSVVLTFIAGLIPARLASRKDPVEALRSE